MTTSPRTLNWRLAALLTLVLGAVAWWMLRDPLRGLEQGKPERRSASPRRPSIERPAYAARSDADYVGSGVCRECHAAICEEYAGHPMSKSVRRVSAADPLEVYGAERGFVFANEFYFAERTGDDVRHHIVRYDAEGEVIYDQSQPVIYEMGSGERGRAFLVQHEGLLFQSPLTWYTGKQGWDLSPGYTGSNRRFSRQIVDGCVACHAGRMHRDRGQTDVYAESPFLEAAIGCERCHGPAADHVAWQRQIDPRSGADPILELSRLTHAQREAVCQQCHFTGHDRVVRYGRGEFDFRPGDRLTDIWLPFVMQSTVEESLPPPAVSHVEQLQTSRCWTASQDRFGCTSCHNPHHTPTPGERVEYYRRQCQQCHTEGSNDCSLPPAERRELEVEDSCVACHMPRLDSGDMPHTALTDHRIMRRPPTSGPAGATRIVLAAVGLESVPQWEQDRAQGIMLARQARISADPVLATEALMQLRPLAEALPEDQPLQLAYAAALALNGDSGRARSVWERILNEQPLQAEAMERLAIDSHDARQFEQAVDYFDRLLKVNSFRADVYARRAHALGQLGRFSDAIPSAQQALELNPSLSVVRSWLVEVCGQTGNTTLQAEQSALLQRLQEPTRLPQGVR